MRSENAHAALALALTQLQSAFQSELQILIDAQRQLEALRTAADEAFRTEAAAALRRQLRLLGKTNAAVKGFLESAVDETRV